MTIKRIFLLCFFLTGIVFFCFADDVRIEEIKKAYTELKQLQPLLKRATRDMSGYSTEGGEAVLYIDGRNRICIMELEFFGEMGKKKEEFYYKNNNLFFILSISEQYNSPINMSSQTDDELKELGMERFDRKKSIIEEKRFYFRDKELIQVLKKRNGKNIAVDRADETNEADDLVQLADDLRKKYYENKPFSDDLPVSD